MSNTRESGTLALSVYMATLVLLWLPPLFPQVRLWGFSYWSYWPPVVRILLFVVCTGAGMYIYHRVSGAPTPGARRGKDPVAPTAISGVQVALLVAVHAALFYLLRTQTHFLGDGYLRLNQLANGTPLRQLHNIGETMLEFGIRGLLPLPQQLAALVTYRFLSILAGALFVAVMAYSSRRLFPDRTRQLLWILIMTSGGFSLLFFGYVENYALFCASVGVFTVVGLLAALGHISVWWIVPSLLVSLLLHGNGIALAPAAIYLGLTRAGADIWLRSRGRSTKVVLAAGTVVSCASVVYLLARNSRFIRHALVPLSDGWHTVEGYTLFSIAHMLDAVNLTFLLIPGLVLMLLIVIRTPGEHPDTETHRAREFLLVCSITVLAAAFLLEAKLGMPRDWDLFSFAGVPPLAYLAFISVRAAARSRSIRGTLALVIALGYIALLSRATILAVPEFGVAQFKSFARLDVKKNRPAWFTLKEYYERAADSAGVEEVARYRWEHYPEEQWTRQCRQLIDLGRTGEAAGLAYRAIRINPMFSTSWLQLGRALLAERNFDSALSVLETADALNPHSYVVLKELGIAYYSTGQLSAAEKCWLETFRLYPGQHETAVLLARYYESRGDRDRYAEFLERACYQPAADGHLAKELGDLKLAAGDLEAAARAYTHALANGVDIKDIEDALESHPGLRDKLQQVE